jgi:hypothetical protein
MICVNLCRIIIEPNKISAHICHGVTLTNNNTFVCLFYDNVSNSDYTAQNPRMEAG